MDYNLEVINALKFKILFILLHICSAIGNIADEGISFKSCVVLSLVGKIMRLIFYFYD